MKIATMYYLRRPVEVLNFLEKNRGLVLLLGEVHRMIRSQFQSERLILEIIIDPEAEGWEELGILIKTQRDPDEALDLLEKVDDLWFSKEIFERANSDLSVHLEY